MRGLRSRRVGRLPLLLLLALFAGACAALIGAPAPDSARAQSPAAQTVPSDWPLIPDGIGPGQSFRLLFVTSTSRDASSSEIADYNAHVQAAAGRNSNLAGFSGRFRALISTASVDARDNTATTGTGVSVHWLGGAKVADDYADLYDKSWDSVSGQTETGSSYGGLVWTGGNKAGLKSGLRHAGAAEVRLGDLGTAGLALSSPRAGASTETYPLYALSPVITVAQPVKAEQATGIEDANTPIKPAPLQFQGQSTQDTEVWTATLTVGEHSTGGHGYCSGAGNDYCGYGSLSDDDFTLDGTDYTVESIRWASSGNGRIHLTLDRDFPDSDLSILKLQVGSHTFNFSDASRGNTDNDVSNNYKWTLPDAWSNPAKDSSVTVKLLKPDTTATQKPAKPTGLSATAGNRQVTLSWTNPDDLTITRYQYRQKTGAARWGRWMDVPRSGRSTVEHLFTGLANGTEYRFRLRAVNSLGNSPQSDEAGPATPQATLGGCVQPLPAGGSVSAATYLSTCKASESNDESESGAKAQYYWFTLAQRSVATISVTGGALGANTSDVILCLLNGHGRTGSPATVDGCEDENDSASGSNREPTKETISVTLAAGDYTIEVAGYDDVDLGFTNLTAQFVDVNRPANTSATGKPSISGTAKVGETLTAAKGTIADTNGLTKADNGDAGFAYTYQWVRVSGGTDADISGATSKTYVLVAADQGKKVKVKVSFKDDDSWAETLTSDAYPTGSNTIAQRAQSSDANLSGLTATSSTDNSTFTALTLTPSTFAAATIAYTATVASNVGHVKLTPTVADSNATVKVGKAGSLATVTSGSASAAIALVDGENAIKVEVTAEDGTKKTYTVTVTRRPANSAATGKPTISGTATVGQTLTAATGTIADTNGITKATAGNAGFAWTYQWIRVDSDGSSNPTNISGATSSTYVLVEADAGKKVKVKVSFKDDDGYAESRTSDAYPTSGTVAAKPKVTLTLTPTTINESGSGNSAKIKATLASAPGAAVVITLTLNPASGVANLSGATLTIPANATESNEETITAEDNDVDAKANATVTISGATTSMLVTAPDAVTLTVTDDDTKGVTVSPTDVSVNEGSTATYTVKLDTKPAANVVVTPTSDDTGAVTVSTAATNNKLTFTTSNWSQAQTVTVTGVQDTDADDESVTVSHAASGSGSGYGQVTIDDVTVAVDDDETAATAPSKPTGLSATAGDAQVALSWDDPSDASITKYQYQKKAGSAAWETSWTDIPTSAAGEANATSYTVTSLSNGTAYRFRIRAVNATGNSPQSDAAGPVTPQAPADTTGPTISTIAVTSSVPSGQAAYKIGDDIKVTATFNEDIVVTGTPKLEITVGSAAKSADCARKGDTGAAKKQLECTYTVATGDTDTDGISVVANKLTLPTGASIKDSSTNDATRTHSAITAQSGHKVDGVKPTISTISITSSPPASPGGWYKSGNVIKVTATFSEALALAGSPTLKIDVGGAEKSATCAKKGTTGDDAKKLECSYTVVANDEDTDGIAVAAGKLAGTIKDGSANAATLTYTAITASSSHKVDAKKPGIAFPASPAKPQLNTASTITLSDSGAKIKKYGAIVVDGSTGTAANCDTSAEITSGGGTVSTEATPVATKSYAYTPPSGSVGKKVCVYVEDAAGNSKSDLWSQTVQAEPTLPKVTLSLTPTTINESGSGNSAKIKATLPSAPSAAVVITLTLNPASGVANLSGATLTIPSTGTASNEVTITAENNDVDAPDATVTISGATASTLATAPDSVTLTVSDDDTAGVTLSRTSVSVNEGSTATYTVKLDTKPTANVVITPTSGDTAAVTVSTAATNNKLTFTTSNWSTPQTVTVTGVQDTDRTNESITVSHSATGGGYGSVSIDDVTVSVDDDDVPAKPTGLSATAGDAQVSLSWDDPSDASITKYQYQKKAGSTAWETTWTDIPTSASGETNATSYTVTSLSNGTAYLFRIRAVNATGNSPESDATTAVTPQAADTTGPTISTIAVTSSVPSGQAAYKIGDAIKVTATFNEDIVVTGTPKLEITVGSAAKSADCARKGASGAAKKQLECTYTVQAGDTDTDGISVAANKLTLPTNPAATIKDGSNNDATRTYTAITTQSAHKVDGVKPTISTISITSTPPASPGGWYRKDSTIAVTATFSEALTLAGSPTLKIDIGGTEKSATCAKKGSTGDDAKKLVCSYTVAADDADTDGIAVAAGKLTGTIKDGSANAATLTYTAITAQSAHKVDATDPGIAFPASPAKPRLSTASTITLTDTHAKVKKYGAIVVASSATNAEGCDTATEIGAANLTTEATPKASVNFSYTPPSTSLGKKVCVYAEDAAGNSKSDLWSQTIQAEPAKPKVTLTLTPTTINESGSGNSAKIKATLPSAPSAAVAITLTLNPASGVANLGGTTLTIPSTGTESNEVTITAEDNDVDAPDATVTITGATTSALVTAPDAVTLTVNDDDTAGVTVSATDVSVNEGATATYTVKLDSEPTANVVITPTSGDTGAVTVSTSASNNKLTFTTSNWSTPQTVTVTGVQDPDAADESVTVTHSATGGGYASVSIDDVTVAVDDDEVLDTTAPTISTIAVSSSVPTGQAAYKIGDDIKVTATFNEDIVVTGTPKLEITVGTAAKSADCSRKGSTGSAKKQLECSYTVTAGDADTDGISVAANKLTLPTNPAATIKDGSNNDATRTHSAITNQSAHKVDGVKPTITTIAVTSSVPSGQDAYKIGDAIKVTATFSEDIVVTGTPKLEITVGAAVKSADCARKGNTGAAKKQLECTYTVQAGDVDANGISVVANMLTLPTNPAATIKDASANPATLTYTAIMFQSSHKVDGVKPTISTIAVTSSLLAGQTAYGIDDWIRVTATFTEDIEVTGTPKLEITVGSEARSASCMREHDAGAAKKNLVCRYQVQAGDADTDGISVAANRITLPSGASITDGSNNDATRTHSLIAASSSHKVEAVRPTVTAGSTGYYSDAALSNALTGTQAAGATIYTKVTFSENMHHVKASNAASRPVIYYFIGNTQTRYHILNNGDTLSSGKCKPNHATNTNVYVCLYTVRASDNGPFKVEVRTASVDKAHNALANTYTHATTLTLRGTVSDRPAAPTGLTATAGDGQVTLNWDDPSDASITKYQVAYRPVMQSTGGRWQDIPNSGPSGTNRTSYTVTGLQNGTKYRFLVRAVGNRNGIASSADAKPVPRGVTTVPARPRINHVEAGNGKIVVYVFNPNDPTIEKYQVATAPPGTEIWRDIPGSSAGSTILTIRGLKNGTGYTYSVRAVNALGPSPGSAIPSSQVTPRFPEGSGGKTVAGVDLWRFTVTESENQLKLRWRDRFPGAWTGYIVEWKESSDSYWQRHYYLSWPGHYPSFTINNLKSGISYDVRVFLRPPSGNGDPIQVFTGSGTPD